MTKIIQKNKNNLTILLLNKIFFSSYDEYKMKIIPNHKINISKKNLEKTKLIGTKKSRISIKEYFCFLKIVNTRI